MTRSDPTRIVMIDALCGTIRYHAWEHTAIRCGTRRGDMGLVSLEKHMLCYSYISQTDLTYPKMLWGPSYDSCFCITLNGNRWSSISMWSHSFTFKRANKSTMPCGSSLRCKASLRILKSLKSDMAVVMWEECSGVGAVVGRCGGWGEWR